MARNSTWRTWFITPFVWQPVCERAVSSRNPSLRIADNSGVFLQSFRAISNYGQIHSRNAFALSQQSILQLRMMSSGITRSRMW